MSESSDLLSRSSSTNGERPDRSAAESRYTDLVNALPDVILWEADAGTLQFTFVSPAAESILGYAVASWLSEPDFWVSHLHPDDKEGAIDACRTATEAGLDHELEYRMVAADGRAVWLHDNVAVVLTSDRRPRLLRGRMLDVTDRKRAEEELRTSEMRHKALFEGNADAVFSLDLQGNFSSANPACARISGYAVDELLGTPFTRFVEAAGLAGALEGFTRVVRGERQEIEVTIEHKSGYPVDLSLTGMPIVIDGKTVGVFGIARDITERKRAEQALRDSEERLRLAMAAGQMGAWEWNIETGEVRWSEGLEIIHGLQPGTFDGTYEGFLNDVHPDDREQLELQIGNSIAQGTHDVEYRIVLPSRGVRWVTGRGHVIYDETGKALRMIGVCMDVTERRRGEEQLRRANEAKDEFLGMISHELRTPITTIYGGARLLRGRSPEMDAEARAAVLCDIEEEAERLRRIVEDLLVLSRLELDAQVPTEPVLLQRILEKAAEAYRRRQRQIQLEIENGLPPVLAEPTYLEQVLRNLLSNAEKYSPSNIPVEVRASRHGEHEAIVRVIDHGRGVSEDEIERLFDRFYRSERTSKMAGGAGIGLTVCRRLLEAQSGRIWATSRDGLGLEVAFTLPLYKEGTP